MRKVLCEIEAKNSLVKKLKEDLAKAEVTLMETQRRESEMEDHLETANREVKQLTLESSKYKGDNNFTYCPYEIKLTARFMLLQV